MAAVVGGRYGGSLFAGAAQPARTFTHENRSSLVGQPSSPPEVAAGTAFLSLTAGSTSGGGVSTIALVQQTSSSTAVTNATITIPFTAAGNLLILGMHIQSTTVTTSSVTDNGGNTWTLAVREVGSSTYEIWYAANVAAGTTTVSPSTPGTGGTVTISEWSGVAASSALIGSQANAQTTSPNRSGSISVAAGNLAFAGFAANSATARTLSSTGWTELTHGAVPASFSGQDAYRVESSAGADEATWTTASGTNTGAAVATFAAAVAPGGAIAAVAAGSASLTMTATGTVVAAPNAAGTATLTLTASGTAVVSPGSVTFADDFNRADGPLGANWIRSSTTASPSIAGNLVIGNAGAQVARWAADASASGTLFSQAVFRSGAYASVLVAMGAMTDGMGFLTTPTFYSFRANQTGGALGTELRQKNAAANNYTLLQADTTPLNNGDVFRLEYDLTTFVLTCKINGATVFTFTPTTPITGQYGVGMGTGSATATTALLDDWSGGTFGAASATAASGAASLSLSVSGATSGVTAGTATLALTATSTGAASSTGTGALALTATGAARTASAGTAALALTATGAAVGPATGTAALSLTATVAARTAAAGTATLVLSGSGSAGSTAAGTASIALAAAGVASTPAAGAASLTLTAAGAGRATSAGTAALALTASGAGQSPAAGTATLALTATGQAFAQGTIGGTASLALTASGAATTRTTGTASLALTATAGGAGQLAGTAALSLTAAGAARTTGAGSATLSLTATGAAQAGPVAAAGTATLALVSTGDLAAQAAGEALLTLHGLGIAADAGASRDVTVLAIREVDRPVTVAEHNRTVAVLERDRAVTVAERTRGVTVTEHGRTVQIRLIP